LRVVVQDTQAVKPATLAVDIARLTVALLQTPDPLRHDSLVVVAVELAPVQVIAEALALIPEVFLRDVVAEQVSLQAQPPKV
jgi:hypothetical protein